MLSILFVITAVDARLTEAAKFAFGDDVKLTHAVIDPKWLVGAGDIQIVAMSSKRCGNVPAVLSWRSGTRESRRQVLLVLERNRTLVKTARDIKPGEVLAEADYTVEHTSRCDPRDDVILSRAEEVLGRKAKVRLVRGTPLRASELEAPPAVKSRERLRLVVRSGLLLVSAPGEALQSGSVGDRIRVTNLLSQNTVIARIVDAQTAEVVP